MAQYINKDAVVSEIERRIADNKKDIERASHSFSANNLEDYFEGYEDALALFKQQFLDTLEVKEVDFEKEINKYISDNFFGSETMGFFAVRTKEEPNDQDIALCAKHFFKLGLKVAQKGE